MALQRPTIAAHVGVKDEITLIAPCIAHLRRIGVTEIVVHDVSSTDGTRDWLLAECAAGSDLRLITTRDDDNDAVMEGRTMDAIRQLRADWLLPMDADEFVLPRGGDLCAALTDALKDAQTDAPDDGPDDGPGDGPGDGATDPAPDLVFVPRYNVALGPEGLRMPLSPAPQTYDQIDLFATADKYYRKKMAADPMLTWVRMIPVPKPMVRLDPLRSGAFTGFTDGLHSVRAADGVPITTTTARTIVTAHAGLSDYPRFARKVDNIRELDRTGLATNYGWTWKRWAAQAEAGLLRGEFDRSVLPEAEIAALRKAGVIRSAADLLERP